MKLTRWLIVLSFVVAAVCFFWFDLEQYLTLEMIQAKSGALRDEVQAHPWWTGSVFFAAYVALTVMSFPGTVVLTLLAGALFGLVGGTLMVSLASNIGALVAMLISRFLLRDWIQKRFKKQIASINRGLERDGAFYLFSLRLIPLVPFVLLNPALGLTRVSMWTFWWTTQAGMLPGHAIYVGAGRQLARIREISDILSPSLIGTLALLAIFPLAATKLLTLYKARKVYSGWQKPKSFEHNLLVVGGGSGGLAAARIAASMKARVALVECERLGGAALHSGSVPVRALMRAANMNYALRQGSTLGIRLRTEVDFAEVMAQVRRTLDEAQEQVTAESCKATGVEMIRGKAQMTSPWSVQVGDRTLCSRAIVIATGSQPVIPPIPGLENVEPLTCENVWDLQQRPERLLIMGGEANACELAQAFQRLGCQVTLAVEGEMLLAAAEPEAREAVHDALRADGVEVLLKVSPQRFELVENERRLDCLIDEQKHLLPFDQVLLALGRKAHLDDLGLERLELNIREDGSLEVDEYLATRYPNVYAVGAVAGPDSSFQSAKHHAWYAAANGLFSGFRRFMVSDRVVPRVAFTSPEIASVGLTEAQAKLAEVEYEVTMLDLDSLEAAQMSAGNSGFLKVLTERGRDRIIGVTLVGDGASETLAVFVLAMKHKLGLNKLRRTVHINPTLAEASLAVAEAWRRAHTAKRPQTWAARLHRWRLGGQP
ncbi:FAD-dependent oxidoreductase [Stutzerimonas xanthomarina]|uniref:FAD-dependent oxidoreductase n=1 Tax=Stutzerimonas xanthomarina TaxID=271420 RepID=UPI0029A442AC|nr:FAD-dependent oxidoreductase [Stutzerimonas xanthomarina]MDX2351097.1 FAD-dependent oxidoreductase [Stutzerimonas xanthomarina]